MIRPGHRLSVVVCVAALAAGGVLDAQSEGDDAKQTRAFEVRYRDLVDAADLVGPLLSDEGSLTFRPRLKILVIEDRAAVLAKVEDLLQSFDLPPRNVEVTLILFLGTDRRKEPKVPRSPNSVFSDEVRGVIDALGDFTKWVAYEPLGSGVVIGAEGDRMVAKLSSDYRVTLKLESVASRDGDDYVRFSSVDLQRLSRDESGVEAVEHLYTTAAVLRAGTLTVVGAAKRPDANHALFLMMQVEAR